MSVLELISIISIASIVLSPILIWILSHRIQPASAR